MSGSAAVISVSKLRISLFRSADSMFSLQLHLDQPSALLHLTFFQAVSLWRTEMPFPGRFG
jgi:hypothetical protein